MQTTSVLSQRSGPTDCDTRSPPSSWPLLLSSSLPSSVSSSVTTTQVVALPPCQPDLTVRRCISDSVLAGHRCRSDWYDNQNTTFLMIHRSGARMVKQMIATIHERCHQYYTSSSSSSSPTGTFATTGANKQNGTIANPTSTTTDQHRPTAPEQECFILAQWAVDSYYRVVISANGGVAALVRAMEIFPYHRELQECCCLALGNLCMSGSSLPAVEQASGIYYVVAAMKNHPHSAAVQSAACDAIRNMLGLVLNHLAQADQDPLVSDLQTMLSTTKDVPLLHPCHRSTASDLLTVISTNMALQRGTDASLRMTP